MYRTQTPTSSACPLSPPAPRSTQAPETFIKGCASHSRWKEQRRITLRQGKRQNKDQSCLRVQKSPSTKRNSILPCPLCVRVTSPTGRPSARLGKQALNPQPFTLSQTQRAGSGRRGKDSVKWSLRAVKKGGSETASFTADSQGALHGHPGPWAEPRPADPPGPDAEASWKD